MTASVFVHAERAVAQRLGLPLEKIREVRGSGFVRGADWQRESNEIRYSEAGLAKLTAVLGVTTEPPAASPPGLEQGRAALCLTLISRADSLPADEPEKNSAPNAAPIAAGELKEGDEGELVVVRTYARNRRIVLAKHGDQEARVRVKDSAKLLPGMIMKCAFVERDLWDIAQRLPRHRGKW